MPRPRIASDVAIGCVDASLARGGRRVVEGVTFDLLRGRVLAIMGTFVYFERRAKRNAPKPRGATKI